MKRLLADRATSRSGLLQRSKTGVIQIDIAFSRAKIRSPLRYLPEDLTAGFANHFVCIVGF
jgi:hypothetical protein